TICPASILFGENVEASVLFVGGAGPGNYTSIQDAIDDSESGDTIFVSTGEYPEHIVIGKPLTILGENSKTTSIVGDGTEDVVLITADWVNITDFTISLSGPYVGDAGIELLDSEKCSITNIVAIDNDIGMILDSSDNNTIINFSASGNEHGIALFESDSNSISNGNVFSNIWYGILLKESNHNRIADSRAMSNTVGVFLDDYSSHNKIENLTASDRKAGIQLFLSNNNTITDSIFTESEIGIKIEKSHGNTIVNTTISQNSVYGIALGLSNDNLIHNNRIVDNENQAVDDGERNQWDNGYPSGGNYWSDYGGNDEKSGPGQDQPGSDGIADSPYNIEYGESRDRYPIYHHEVTMFEEIWILGLLIAAAVLIALYFLVRRTKKEKNEQNSQATVERDSK
ncbi:MAG: right-handed parallel beta-helix repeat-containing protein, partial [Thermoplasmata archaeon]|nr:right-handed parallel beta-helix repeat-containing protein [Thermoplasmata archaeon]